MQSRRQSAEAAWSSQRRSWLCHCRRNHSLDVLGQDVELEIHEIGDRCTIEIGMIPGVRSDPHSKASRQDFRNGKTDSIDADRTLRSHIMPGCIRQSDFKSEVCASPFESENGRDAIDVTLNEMSAYAGVSA